MAFSSPQLDAIIAAGAGGIPTTALWQEIKDLIENNYGVVSGNDTLGGVSGTTVTFADIGTVDYDVFYYVATGGTVGSIGEITITIVDSTSFTLVNSGSNTTASFYYRVVPR